MNYNNLLILERSSGTLTSKTADGSYVLEGIFGEIDKKNKNNRIYTEAEYVPQIEALQEKIKSSKLLGELDHPAKFDISLKNVSHIIEELTYDKETKQVRGKIRLLDTDAGKQAKALVDAGVPLQISSRAAGAVESDGKVKIKQLFTYDLVADPGFANAELNRINESFGLSDDSNIQIFKITEEDLVIEETKTIQNNNKEQELMENKARFVSVEDFNKYSEYLSEEIKTLKNALAGTSTDNIEEKLNTLTSYVEYVAERADKSIQYTEYLAENLDKNIDYSNYVAEKLDESISYTEHIAESANKIKEYSNYLAESMNEGAVDYENVTKYLNYLKENVESVSEYTDYIAETINANLIVEDEAGIEVEDMKADTKEINSEDDKKIIKAGDAIVPTEADAITEEGAVNENPAVIAMAAAELLKKKEGEARPEDEDDEINAEKDEVEKDELEEAKVDPALVAMAADALLKKKKESEDTEDDDTVEVEIADEVEETISAIDAYKNEISEKLSELINKSVIKENNNPHFFRLVSEATQERYNTLEEADKSKVLASVEGRGYLTEGQINTLMESALVEVAGQTAPYFVEAMPSEYKEAWTALSETKKVQIAAQARMVKLTSPYQVKNFWDTRDLREVSRVMEKVEMIKESKVAEAPKSTLTYSTEGIGEALAKRFKK
tara:strand:+ start:21778 stop:23787 length:2010 start_codon:yes stop_codon:yes gene_type:complete